MMKDAFVAAIAVACAALLMAVGVRAADLPSKFDPTRDAARDVESALALAKAQGKRVIVDVGGEWCSWCHVLDRVIAANDDVRDTLAMSFVWLKVNYSKQNENAAVLQRWPRVAGYPHLFVLDVNGVVVASQDTELLEDGRSYNKKRFLDFLARAASAQPSRAATAYGPFGLVGPPMRVL
jgi:thiol:disulfide interchange protein